MRIVSGKFRGKILAAPDGRDTRPTSDRARQAVFNILEHAAFAPPLAEARVIDLFAGSGALGLEALSRGAAFCLFVETDDRARGAIRENIDAMGLFGVSRLHRRDATDLGPRPASAASSTWSAWVITTAPARRIPRIGSRSSPREVVAALPTPSATKRTPRTILSTSTRCHAT